MSTDASSDPVPYRKDLRKKMDLEKHDSRNTEIQNESNNDKDYDESVE